MSARLRRAAIQAGWKQPFLWRIAAGIKEYIEDNERIPTIGVMKDKTIKYNKNFIDSLNDDELAGAVAHEMMHLITVYFQRRGDRDHMLFNVAADMAINSIIVESDLVLPEGAAYPPTTEMQYMSAEQIYEKLKEMGYKPPEPSFANGCGVEDDDRPLTAEEEHDFKEMVKDVKKGLPGDGVGKRLFTMLGDPPRKDRYSTILRGCMGRAQRRSGRDDQSFAKRNRRSPEGIVLPGWVGLSAKGAVIIDTSGSMSDAMLTKCIGETISIQRTFPEVRLYLILHDVNVYFEGWVNAKNATKLARRFTRRGGTSFDGAYRALDKLGRLDFAVHLTDGELWGAWPHVPFQIKTFVLAQLGNATIVCPKEMRKLQVEI